MDTVLVIIGILGLGAMVIAAYVFAVSARNYVSEGSDRGLGYASATAPCIERSKTDRRQQVADLPFPTTVNGVLIENNRRQLTDRRLPA